MIIIWVTELFMNQMGALRNSNISYLHDSQYIELQKQLDSFLGIPKVEVLESNRDQWKFLYLQFSVLLLHEQLLN